MEDQARLERDALLLELEEERWLNADAVEDALLRARRTPDRAYKAFSVVSASYLALNALSVRVPGLAHWLGLDQHVHLIGRITHLL